MPPVVVTWADAQYLQAFRDDIAALRERADIVIVSCHWGQYQEVLQYMTEIAHAAIEAGADLVIGHGPHYSLPVEMYRGKPIFYGLGSFSFHTGHGGKQHGDWIGMLAHAAFDGGTLERASFRFVRHNASNETVLCALADESVMLAELTARSAALGARLTPQGDDVIVSAA